MPKTSAHPALPTKRTLPWNKPNKKDDQISHRRINVTTGSRKLASTTRNANYKPVNFHEHEPKLRYVYCRNADSVSRALSVCLSSREAVALDMEWNPFSRGYQRKTALIQLCTSHAVGYFPQDLKGFLEDEKIMKIGLNIKGDALKLYRDFNVRMRSWVELSSLAKAILPERFVDTPHVSLQLLVERVLGLYLSKDDRIRMGNWEAQFLSTQQTDYAANDAYSTFLAYQQLMAHRDQMPNGSQILVETSSVDEWLQIREAEAELETKRIKVDKSIDESYFTDLGKSQEARSDESGSGEPGQSDSQGSTPTALMETFVSPQSRLSESTPGAGSISPSHQLQTSENWDPNPGEGVLWDSTSMDLIRSKLLN
ncbi:hypothetical protein HK102_000098 [Quaeritorhiza haematococci]|nr:hypothetical protein HK102_000098 [Quaeritorhiza haematococci]